jgi:diguanylate cyclase (GGDEF)-like protein
MDLQDRTVFGYEALPRGSVSHGGVEFVRGALSAVQYTSPALLFVPLAAYLLADETFDPFGIADEIGVTPGEIAWLIAEAAALDEPDLVEKRAVGLRERGFKVALSDVAPGVLRRGVVGELFPRFVFLDLTFPAYVSSGVRARAELAGLLAYCGRLSAHVVSTGIANDASAKAMTSLSVRLGTGPHLGPPVVLDASAAEPGDQVVAPAWFRQQEVRVLTATGGTLDAPALIAKLPTGGDLPMNSQEFSWSLGEAARKMQAEHDPARILEVTTEHLPRAVRADNFAIFEADWERYRFWPRVLQGKDVRGFEEIDFSIDLGITGWAFLRGSPYNCPDTRSHPEAIPIPGEDLTSLEESLLVVPLIAGDHRLGVICMWRNGLSQFSQEELERCALFGYITAAAWRNAQLYAELELRAMTDTLTGLFNHRWWDEMATREAALSSREGSEMGILLLDLDNFKRVNDEYGHLAGDALLRNVGRAIKSTLRIGDAAIRYGGEEFLLMLHGTDETGALRVGEAVREALAKLPTPGPAIPRVTVSIGVAFHPRHGESLSEVVEVADVAMYQAKAEGRDRIILAPTPGADTAQPEGADTGD